MTHILFDHDLSAADPRRHPSPGTDDNRGAAEDVYDPDDEEENVNSDTVSEGDEEVEEEDEEPSSNDRRGYGDIPRQR